MTHNTKRNLSKSKSTKSANSQKKGLPIFLGKVFAVTGDFGPSYPHIGISRWITCHGGEVKNEVTEETTHLICSIEDYKKKVPHVKRALALGKRRCAIVVIDWLEDCLVRKTGQRVVSLSEKPYLLETVLKRVRRAEKEKARHTKEFITNIEMTRELADPLLYSIYYDTTFFRYEVRLCRITLSPKHLIEKYTIYLFQSHAIPPLYMVGAKYQKGRQPAVLHREMCFPREFSSAFADFKRLFKKKTSIDWDQRLDNLKTAGDVFKYTPPERGKPQGVMPMGWTPPGGRPDTDDSDMPDSDSSDVSEGSGSTAEVAPAIAARSQSQNRASVPGRACFFPADQPQRIALAPRKQYVSCR